MLDHPVVKIRPGTGIYARTAIGSNQGLKIQPQEIPGVRLMAGDPYFQHLQAPLAEVLIS
jgi:hypothetical protein